MHGEGVYVFNSGAMYAGNYVRGKKSGFGILKEMGCEHRGIWSENRKHGRGRATDTDGRTFYGKWQNGERHGRGGYLKDEKLVDCAWWVHGARETDMED